MAKLMEGVSLSPAPPVTDSPSLELSGRHKYWERLTRESFIEAVRRGILAEPEPCGRPLWGFHNAVEEWSRLEVEHTGAHTGIGLQI